MLYAVCCALCAVCCMLDVVVLDGWIDRLDGWLLDVGCWMVTCLELEGNFLTIPLTCLLSFSLAFPMNSNPNLLISFMCRLSSSSISLDFSFQNSKILDTEYMFILSFPFYCIPVHRHRLQTLQVMGTAGVCIFLLIRVYSVWCIVYCILYMY